MQNFFLDVAWALETISNAKKMFCRENRFKVIIWGEQDREP